MHPTLRPPAVLWLLVLPCLSHAYRMFQDRLPNGGFVPHPCKPNYLWKGVGHEAIGGGGARNAFGRDFAANGYKWDSCLCLQDSDGDGLTNGEELGDPDCTYTQGGIPKHKFGLSHPGICEPLDDPVCQRTNDFEIDCDAPEELVCEPINSPDVRNITIRYPPTSVPAQETTYMCMTFDLPDDQDYHLIAYEPIIDNEDVMHHIVLYGCIDTEEETVASMDAPDTCDMAMDGCFDILALWGIGAKGACLNEEMGFRFGKNGYKTVNLQNHWTNPAESTQYMDSSGMILYYTPVLRNNDATVVQNAQFYLQIPPGKPAVNFEATCSSRCTGKLAEPVYITNAILHMHYQGHAGYSEIWRDGQKVQEIVATDDYDYDTPDIISFDPPLELRPGDEIRSGCTFNSRNQKSITYWGDGSYDEMCIVFLTYYPRNPYFINCGHMYDQDVCSLDWMPGNYTWMEDDGKSGNYTEDEGQGDNDREWDGSEKDVENDEYCDYDGFSNDPVVMYLFGELGKSCDPMGAECNPGCEEKVNALREYPCMKGIHEINVENALASYGPEYAAMRNMLRSCDVYDNLGDGSNGDDDDDENRTGRDRYDPDTNNLPVGGVCPFGSDGVGDGGATGEGATVHAGVGMLTLTLVAIFLL